MNTARIGRLVAINAAFALTGLGQAPDLQELQNKLVQFEESTQRAIQELKAQIAALEQKSKAATPTTPAPTAVPAALAPEIQPPPDHYGAETRKRQTVGENELSAPRIDNESLDPEMRGFFRLPNTHTFMKFGGFVKTDAYYDVNQAGTYYGAYVPSSFPSSPTPHAQNATVSMRPTRFTWETRQDTLNNNGNSVKIYFEFDFLSNYDRNSIRLRQFYAQYKNIVAGQTWSAFSDPDAFPDTLDIEGPPGMIAARLPQVRYTQPLGKHHSVGVSVEKSGTDIPFSTQFGVPVGSSTFPDLIGFYRYENSHGHIHTAALFRNVGGVVPNETVLNLARHTGAYGLSVSGAWGLPFFKKDSLVFQLVLGKGISNYYNDNFGLGTDVGFDATGHLVATPTGSGNFGYTHNWSKLLRTSVSYGYLRVNSPAGDPPTTYHVSNYATVNFIVQPTVRLSFGAEYIYGSLERKDDFKWIAPRIQASVQYYINKYPRE
jgi:hypothetical protein